MYECVSVQMRRKQRHKFVLLNAYSEPGPVQTFSPSEWLGDRAAIRMAEMLLVPLRSSGTDFTRCAVLGTCGPETYQMLEEVDGRGLLPAGK